MAHRDEIKQANSAKTEAIVSKIENARAADGQINAPVRVFDGVWLGNKTAD